MTRRPANLRLGRSGPGRARWFAGPGVLLLGAGFFLLGAGNGSALDDAPSDRVITDPAIVESSGLARSLRHPGVLWTHNDSGNPARIYAIGPNGRTRAVLSIDTPYNHDWESIATLRGPDGTPMIAIGDIGDNTASRKWAEILLLPEPTDLRSQTVKPTRTLRFRYPGGARDAEALLADPTDGRLYVVSKLLFGAGLYSVPAAQWPARATGYDEFKLTTVATLGADLVTDGTFLPDGRMLVRGYGSLTLLGKPADVKDGLLPALAVRRLPAQDQGESLTLTADAKQALIGSEGKDEPVLRVPLPVAGTDPTEEFADPSAGASPTATGSSPAVSLPAVSGSLQTLLIVGGLTLAVLAMALGIVVFRR